jgi:hypothetical protein
MTGIVHLEHVATMSIDHPPTARGLDPNIVPGARRAQPESAAAYFTTKR